VNEKLKLRSLMDKIFLFVIFKCKYVKKIKKFGYCKTVKFFTRPLLLNISTPYYCQCNWALILRSGFFIGGLGSTPSCWTHRTNIPWKVGMRKLYPLPYIANSPGVANNTMAIQQSLLKVIL
jgi:hypothetical protein